MRLTAFASAPETVRVHDQLFAEHVDEAAFLYEQRRNLLGEQNASWTKVEGIERRIDAHLDALLVGRARARDICLSAVKPGSSGELFVATSLLCRNRDSQMLARFLNGLADLDAPRIVALRDALRVELPPEWTAFAEAALAGANPVWVAVFADVSGYRRIDLSAALTTALGRRVAVPQIAQALGQLRNAAATHALWECLQDPDDSARSAALVALCRIGDTRAVRQGADSARQEVWPSLALGLGGDQFCVQTLVHAVRAGHGDAATIEALGLLGDAAAIPVLHQALSSDELAPVSALALHWITGAPLYEEVFVEDAVEEATLSTQELAVWRAEGKAPLRADGQPYGETVCRLTQDPQAWTRWIEENLAKWQPGLRYRLGKLCSAHEVASCLAHPQTHRRLREFAAQELVTRYGCDVPFEIDMPVARQRRMLATIAAWANDEVHRGTPGAWTLGGVTL